MCDVRSKGYRLCGQFHDEIIFPLLKGQENNVKKDLEDSIEQVNEKLRLNEG